MVESQILSVSKMNMRAVINNKSLQAKSCKMLSLLQKAKRNPRRLAPPGGIQHHQQLWPDRLVANTQSCPKSTVALSSPRTPSQERAYHWEKKRPIYLGLFIKLALNVYSQDLTWQGVKDHTEKKPVPSLRKCMKHQFLFLAAVVSITRVTAALLWFLKNFLDKKGQQNQLSLLEIAAQSSCKTMSSSWQKNKTKPSNATVATCLLTVAHSPSEVLYLEQGEGGEGRGRLEKMKSYKVTAQNHTETLW